MGWVETNALGTSLDRTSNTTPPLIAIQGRPLLLKKISSWV